MIAHRPHKTSARSYHAGGFCSVPFHNYCPLDSDA
jgi:hypothetical protein